MLRKLIDMGMDVARLNLSHGAYEEHEETYRAVRQASDESGHAVGILVDLQGPKIRLGRFASGPVALEVGDRFTITTEDVPGDRDLVSTTYAGLAGDARPGDRILIDDGKVCVQVVEVDGPRVVTEVLEGGVVSNHKGLNLPGVAVSVPAMSDKDESDLRWGLHLRADLIALSFVRSAADVEDVRKIMDEEGVRLPVIAKIEKPQAVANLEEIVTAFDGLMVARGDLGVELPLEQVPLVQKRAVELARRNAKPVIVATQMLDSMIENSRPTRAEASDCANAVLDGADALMLSGETSVGKHPLEAVAHDGPDHREHRGPRPGADRAARHPAQHQGRRDHRRGRRDRRVPRREVPRRASPRAATRPAGWPGCARGSRCWPSLPSRTCGPSCR